MCFFSWILWQKPHDIVRTPLTGAHGTEAWRVEQVLRHDFGFSPELSLVLILEGRQSTVDLQQRLRDSFSEIHAIQEIQSKQDHRHQLYYVSFDTRVTLPEAQKWVVPMRQMLI